jgi:hypothetical protein
VTNTATDNKGNTSQCTFTVTVAAGNHAPVANGDSYSLPKNSPLTVGAPGVLSNDTDLDGNTLVAVIVNGPLSGSVTLNSNGGFTYTPSNNYVGSDSFTYQASDGFTNSGIVTVTLLVTNVPVGVQFGILAGAIVLNPQTGLFEQNVTITNAGDATAAGVRLLVNGLRANVYLYNASGTNGGRPYAQYNGPLNPSETVHFLLEFYVADRRPVTNSLEAQAVLPVSSGANSAGALAIDRAFIDTRIPGSPRFLIEFTTIPGRTYTIIYSEDGGATWNAATPSLTANANRTQWYDDGPPKTGSKPLSNPSRLYRVVLAPANP